MKKLVISVCVMLVVLLFPVNSIALPLWEYTSRCNPSLSFTGTTANCTLYIKAYDDSAKITATLTLIRENTDGTEKVVKTWPDLSDTGSLTFSGTKSVSSGQTYRLEVSSTVKTSKGVEYPYEYVRATCP